MRVLKVIHGYPPLYNAGSEVYSQLLCLRLAKEHRVDVFTREENPFAKDFSVRCSYDHLDNRIKLHIINIPLEKYRYKFVQANVDARFAELLEQIKPDVVHIGHLNHLSTSLVYEIAKRKIPIVYTLHDYWIMCPRGQFIQRNSHNSEELWALCDGQKDSKCAKKCYAGYHTGIVDQSEQDIIFWTDWIKRRMQHMCSITDLIDLFIAPSHYLYNRFLDDFGLPQEKLTYLDYGFDLERLKGRTRTIGEVFTFGYIGTHIPAKGIQHLINAFALIKGNCLLKIWGRYHSQNTDALKAIAAKLPMSIQNRIIWLPEYRNENIISDVFNHIDCLVVPSIWLENSPLVIHEALQARVAVITANAGGMADYVHHEKNGLLFEHRNINSLAEQMQKMFNDTDLAKKLSQSGYLQSNNGDVPSIEAHADILSKLYVQLLTKQREI